MIEISTEANEQGTAFVTFSFTDEDGVSKSPTSIKWTLTDVFGNVINSREQVAVAVPASSVTITLSGKDLSILSNEVRAEKVDRYVIIEVVYNSTLGSGLPATEQGMFPLNNLKYIT
jgi:hypothetical protein